MKPYKARAIVLHTIKYGDTSCVAYLLTDALGRQNYMVQGVKSRSGKGNKAALLQPMFILEMEGMEIPGAQMHRIKELRNLVPLHSVPFDVRKSTIALFMAEVLYRLVKEVEVNSPLFDFLCAAMVALDAMQDGVANFHLWFMVKLSSLLGFYPGNQHQPGMWFDIKEGHFTRIPPDHRLRLSQDDAQILSELMDTPLEGIENIRLSRTQRSAFLQSMLDYFGYHLDQIHAVQSIQVLKEVF